MMIASSRDNHKILIISMICFSPLFTFSQNLKVDSLKSLLATKSKTEEADILYSLAYEYVNFNYDLGLRYASKAFDVAKETGDSLKIVKAGRIKSLAFRRLNKIDSSMAVSVEILAIARRNHHNEEMKAILNGLALAYTFKAFYDKALKCHFESLELRQKGGNKSEISVALHGVGLVYYKLKDFDNAISYFTKAVQLKREVNETDDLDLLLNNIGLCYASKGNFALARTYVMDGFASCNTKCSDVFLMNAHFSLGLISFMEHNFAIAEKEFLESYALANKLYNGRYQFDNIIYLLPIYIRQNRMELVDSYLNQIHGLLSTNSPYNLELMKIYSQLANIYGDSKNFKKVALYQSKYIAIKDSIFNEELTTNLMKLEAEHLEKENRLTIASQQKILALNNEVIFRQNVLNVFAVVIVALLIVLTLVLVRSNDRKKRVNQILDKKVGERTHELELNRDGLQRACEARDIILNKTSADIKNSLATLKGLCNLALRDVEDLRAREYLDKMNAASDTFASIVRNLHVKRLEL
jgi:tetratricopeptide (TPR) repeat protein